MVLVLKNQSVTSVSWKLMFIHYNKDETFISLMGVQMAMLWAHRRHSEHFLYNFHSKCRVEQMKVWQSIRNFGKKTGAVTQKGLFLDPCSHELLSLFWGVELTLTLMPDLLVALYTFSGFTTRKWTHENVSPDLITELKVTTCKNTCTVCSFIVSWFI